MTESADSIGDVDTGQTDLSTMLATLTATARDGVYVVATVPAGHPAVALAEATVVEAEGTTVVLRREHADELAVEHRFEAAWISLTVHSSLEAVGLTAAFSRALADADVGCNVLAGAHHDHLLVPWRQRDTALAVLHGLRTH